MSKLPEFMRDGWRSLGRGACGCPHCGAAVSTNALARASHKRGCLGSVAARVAAEREKADRAKAKLQRKTESFK